MNINFIGQTIALIGAILAGNMFFYRILKTDIHRMEGRLNQRVNGIEAGLREIRNLLFTSLAGHQKHKEQQ